MSPQEAFGVAGSCPKPAIAPTARIAANKAPVLKNLKIVFITFLHLLQILNSFSADTRLLRRVSREIRCNSLKKSCKYFRRNSPAISNRNPNKTRTLGRLNNHADFGFGQAKTRTWEREKPKHLP